LYWLSPSLKAFALARRSRGFDKPKKQAFDSRNFNTGERRTEDFGKSCFANASRWWYRTSSVIGRPVVREKYANYSRNWDKLSPMHALPSVLHFLLYIANQLPGLLTGILLAVVGVYLHRQTDRRKKQDELVFQVYMRLFDLHGRHFWIYSQESSGRQSDLRPGVRFNRVRWRMADLLRQVDSLPELPAILHAMFNLNRFSSEKERHEEIGPAYGRIGCQD
jgi:hypothetical protein